MKRILFALLLGTLATAASAELMYYGDDSPRIELDRSRIDIDRSDRAYERRGRYDDDYRYDRRYRDYDDYRRDSRRYRDYGYTFDSDNGFNIRYGWGNDRTRIDMRYGNGYRRYRDDYDDGYRRRYRLFQHAFHVRIKRAGVGIRHLRRYQHITRHAVALRGLGKGKLQIVVNRPHRFLAARRFDGGAQARKQHIAAHLVLPRFRLPKIHNMRGEFIVRQR